MYIIESILFSIIIAVINWHYYPMSFLFIGDAANPYQLLSICMSVRYGSGRGFVSCAIILAAGSIAGSLTDGCEKLFENDVIYFMISVFLASHIAGLLKDNQSGDFEAVIERNKKISEDFEKCTLNNLMLIDANKELTQKIVTRFQSLSTVYEAARKLETLSIDKLYPAALEILNSHVGVRCAAIYLYENQKYNLKSKMGGSDFEESLPFGKPSIVTRAFELKKTISQRDYILERDGAIDNDEALADDNLVVSPVIFGGTLYGMVIIKEIAFENYTDSSIRMISIISEWIGMCIDKIENFSRIEAEVPIDQNINCYKPEFLKKVIKSEISKAVRYKLQLSICHIKIADSDRIAAKMKTSVYFTISYIIKNAIRDIDIYGACVEKGCLIVILPVTDSRGAEIFSSRLSKEIESFKIKPYEGTDRDLNFKLGTYSLFEFVDIETIRKIPFEIINEETSKIHESILSKIDF